MNYMFILVELLDKVFALKEDKTNELILVDFSRLNIGLKLSMVTFLISILKYLLQMINIIKMN